VSPEAFLCVISFVAMFGKKLHVSPMLEEPLPLSHTASVPVPFRLQDGREGPILRYTEDEDTEGPCLRFQRTRQSWNLNMGL
jgi:hypothetical protein